MSEFEFGGPIAWRPTQDYIEHSRLTAFIRKHGLSGLDDLMDRSTRDLEWFWRAVMDDLGIEFYEPYTKIVDDSQGIAEARWCIGGRMTSCTTASRSGWDRPPNSVRLCTGRAKKARLEHSPTATSSTT
jgi:hypothetical protein